MLIIRKYENNLRGKIFRPIFPLRIYLLQDWMEKVASPTVGGTIGLLREIVKDFMEIATEVVKRITRAVQGKPLLA